MKVIVYGEPTNKPLAALADGLSVLGHKPLWRNPSVFRASETEVCDGVAVLGLQRSGRAIRDAYRAKGVPAVVADLGYWRRPEYFALGLESLNWIPQVECPEDRARAMGLMAPDRMKQDGEYILLIGQKPGDAQHTIRDMGAWALKRLAHIREAEPGANVVWRPHPGAVFEIAGVDGFHDPARVTLEQSLAAARRMVTHNSASAYAAFVEGVAVECDSCAIYADAAQAGQAALQSFLNRLAHAQWTLAELMDGTALRFVLPIMTSMKAASAGEHSREIQTLRGRIGLLEDQLSREARASERLTGELQHCEQERKDAQAQLAEARRRVQLLEQENLALKESAEDEAARKSRPGKGRP